MVKKGLENRSNMNFLNKINALIGTGISHDFDRIIERARVDSISFRENFSSVLAGKILASRISSLIHLQTRYWHIRPLCCSLFLASINLNIPELYVLTHTGHYLKCFSGSLRAKFEKSRMRNSCSLLFFDNSVSVSTTSPSKISISTLLLELPSSIINCSKIKLVVEKVYKKSINYI